MSNHPPGGYCDPRSTPWLFVPPSVLPSGSTTSGNLSTSNSASSGLSERIGHSSTSPSSSFTFSVPKGGGASLSPPAQLQPRAHSSPPTAPAQPSQAQNTVLVNAPVQPHLPPSNAEQDAPELAVDRCWGGTAVFNCSTSMPGQIGHGGWLRLTHLDGSLYYYEQERALVTRSDITIPATLAKLNSLWDSIAPRLMQCPQYCVLFGRVYVFEDMDDKSPTIFMLDYARCAYVELSSFVDGKVREELTTEKFWIALRDYPMHVVRLPTDIDVQFLAAMSFGASERILQWNETSYPFTDEQTRRLVQVYRDLKSDLDRKLPVVPALCWHIARTMVKIESARKASKFGTPEFKLYHDVVTEKLSWKVKVTDIVLMIILFGAHRTYRTRLQSARVKGTVYLNDFRELLRNLLAEWSDSNLLATVFVGANIAFLAVPDITSVQRTASLVSTVFSVLSVAIGVYHVWQHRTKLEASSDEASEYLTRFKSIMGGDGDGDLALNACFLSVPVVALLWAVLSFSVALMAFCVQSTDVHGRVLLLVVFSVVASAGLATLSFFWNVWRGPRDAEISEEDITQVLEYGWRSRTKKAVSQGKGFIRSKVERASERIRKHKVLSADQGS